MRPCVRTGHFVVGGDARVKEKQARRPASERPRERLRKFGAEALSDHEILAVILRTGDRRRDAESLARNVLVAVGGIEGLAGALPPMIERVSGLGPVKAASLMAASELGRRLFAKPLLPGHSIGCPADVQRHFHPRLIATRRESFYALLLDGRHRLIAEDRVSLGTLNSSLVHPREVFRRGIQCAAAAIVLVHNHPSGDPAPSAEDRAVTERLAAVGELVGISIVDHVIVAQGGYFSFREAGEMPIPSGE